MAHPASCRLPSHSDRRRADPDPQDLDRRRGHPGDSSAGQCRPGPVGWSAAGIRLPLSGGYWRRHAGLLRGCRVYPRRSCGARRRAVPGRMGLREPARRAGDGTLRLGHLERLMIRSHLTQGLLNYFDETDARVRETANTLDAQLLNTAAVSLEAHQLRVQREVDGRFLATCPLNLDNLGIYYRVQIPVNFLLSTDANGNLQRSEEHTSELQ